MMEDPFPEYLRQSDPSKRAKSYAWNTAIGLQAVDGLQPSDYLVRTAVRNVEGEISLAEAEELLHAYYRENPAPSSEERTEEADKVAARIAAMLSEDAFSFTPGTYLGIHERLFRGIYQHAGRLRNFNISKKEWILEKSSVTYGDASMLLKTLDYDIAAERDFSYSGLTMDETIRHLARFISNLWQIHLFEEGNTRTTAVFLIKYLRSMGFDVTNDVFARNAWYFHNALVRANYTDVARNVYETTQFLELFLRKLLLDDTIELRNRTMHISGAYADYTASKVDIEGTGAESAPRKVDIEGAGAEMARSKVDIEGTSAESAPRKVDIEGAGAEVARSKVDIEGTGTEPTRDKVDIEGTGAEPAPRKVDIGSCAAEPNRGKADPDIALPAGSAVLHPRTAAHVSKLRTLFPSPTIFGRSDVMAALNLKPAGASRLLRQLVDKGIIEAVRGRGKGKYRLRHFTQMPER